MESWRPTSLTGVGLFYKEKFMTHPPNVCLRSGNCTQSLPTVKLDPTTRAGASCTGLMRRDLVFNEIPIFINQLTYPSA